MSANQILAVGIRLFSLWLCIFSIKFVIYIPYIIGQVGHSAEKALHSSLFGALLFFASLLIWFFSMAIARLLVPKDEVNTSVVLSTNTIARVGCALIGLWLFSKSVAPLAGLLVYKNFLQAEVGGASITEAVVYIVQLLVGSFLMVKSHWVANRVLKL